MTHTLSAALCFLGGAVPIFAQSTLGTFQGDPATEYAAVVANAGDVNLDGFDDIVLGAPKAAGGGTERGRVVVRSGSDDSVLYDFAGDADFQQLGFSVSGAGDVNMDGYPDFVAGSFGGNYARVWSGFNGSVIDNYTTPQNGDLLGHCVSPAGDVNADGYDDVIVGSNRLIVFAPGFARVFSGFDGSELYTFSGSSLFDGFGTAVAGGGDANDDGVPDFLVGGKRDDLVGIDAGIVRLFSGLDGSTLHVFTGDNPDDFFGASIDFAGDIDGDGHDDIIVGAPGCGVATFCGTFAGYARVFSGDTGVELYTLRGKSIFENYGSSVSAAGDVDGDGRADFAIGARNADDRTRTDNGRVELRSGATGAIIFRSVGDSSNDGMGIAVAGGGDFNGDQVPDLLIGSTAGYARTRSIRLGRGAHTISTASGGVQSLSIVAGPAFAGMPVAIMGTLNGTTPGMKVGSVKLPLNLAPLNPFPGTVLTRVVFEGLRLGDSRLLRALIAPGSNRSPLTIRVGFLDERGEARSSVSIAPGTFSVLAGTSLNHAYIVFDPQAQRAILSSNPVALDLTL